MITYNSKDIADELMAHRHQLTPPHPVQIEGLVFLFTEVSANDPIWGDLAGAYLLSTRFFQMPTSMGWAFITSVMQALGCPDPSERSQCYLGVTYGNAHFWAWGGEGSELLPYDQKKTARGLLGVIRQTPLAIHELFVDRPYYNLPA